MEYQLDSIKIVDFFSDQFLGLSTFFYSPPMNLFLLEIYALGNIKQDIGEYLVGCLYRKPSSLYYNGLYLFNNHWKVPSAQVLPGCANAHNCLID